MSNVSIMSQISGFVGLSNLGSSMQNVYNKEFGKAAFNFGEGIARLSVLALGTIVIGNMVNDYSRSGRAPCYSSYGFISYETSCTTSGHIGAFCHELDLTEYKTDVAVCVKHIFDQTFPKDIFDKILSDTEEAGKNVALYCKLTAGKRIDDFLTYPQREECISKLLTNEHDKLKRILSL